MGLLLQYLGITHLNKAPMFPNFILLFLLNLNNEVLLLRRINTPFGNLCYCLPGTEIPRGKSATNAAVNEAKKSLGVELTHDDLEPVHVMHRKCNEPEFFAVIFKPQRWNGSIHNLEPERYDDMQWFPLDALPDTMVNAHRHAIQEIRFNNFYSEHGWNSI